MSSSLIYLNQVLGNCCLQATSGPLYYFCIDSELWMVFTLLKGWWKEEKAYTTETVCDLNTENIYTLARQQRKKGLLTLCALISIQFGIYILFFNCIIPFTFLRYCLYIIFILNTFVMNQRSFMIASEIVRIFYKSLV